jgi:hypothetical protein
MDSGSGPLHDRLVRIDAQRAARAERHVGLLTLVSKPTLLVFRASSRGAPVVECRFNAVSQDIAELASDDLTDVVARLRAAFALSEPTKDSDGFWQMTGRSSANGRSVNVEVTYELQENRPASFLHVHVSR